MVGNVGFSLGGDADFRDLGKLSSFFLLFLNAVKIKGFAYSNALFCLWGLPEGDFAGLSSLCTARVRFQLVFTKFFYSVAKCDLKRWP